MYFHIIHQLTGQRREFSSKSDLDQWIYYHPSLNSYNAKCWRIYRSRPTEFLLCNLWDYMYAGNKFKTL